MITSPHTSSARRRRTLAAAVATLLAAALLGPSAALADSISVVNHETDPTVGETAILTYEASVYADSVAYLYLEEGRASCPSSAGAAGDAGMALMDSSTHHYPSLPQTEVVYWQPSTEGEYLFCAYTHRGSDTATARGTDALIVNVQEPADAPIVTIASTQPLTTSNTITAEVSCPRACSLSVNGWAGTDSRSASVTLGTATASIGTFGGSATMRVPMTTAQRRELRARLVAGERVRAELDATSTADNGSSHRTSATTELTLLTVGSFTPGVRVFSGV